MKIIVKNEDVFSHKTDVLIVPFYENSKIDTSISKIDAKLNMEITYLLKNKIFRAELKETRNIDTHRLAGAANIMMLGLGQKEKLKTDDIRKAYAIAGKAAKHAGFRNISVLVPDSVYGKEKSSQMMAEGIILGVYEFSKYITVEKEKISEISLLAFIDKDIEKTSRGSRRGQILAENANAIKDLVNEPAEVITPSYLADYARRIAGKSKDISVKVFGRKEILKMGMNGLYSVGKGSAQEQKFIILEYKGRNEKPIILVGKGITFDAGGLNIKPWDYMLNMRDDMAGAATVLQTIKTAKDLGIKRHIISIVPACENLLGERAFKQGDIIKSYNGKTIEVHNTDAEGRLILADALGYADMNYNASAIIDIATLTGASVYALGYEISALMSYDESLKKKIIDAGKKADEHIWELPMIEEYNILIKGESGDVRNTSRESAGPGTITAGIFLSSFVEKAPWAHIDIGASAWIPYDKDYKKKGATGQCLRTFIEFFESR